MSKEKVLIVDDEEDIRELLAITLSRMGIKSASASDLKQAYELIQQEGYFLCLTDMRLPDGDGIELVHYVQENMPQLPIAVITAFGNVEGAVNTLKAGAFDYVSKPVNVAMLKGLIQTAYELSQQNQLGVTDELIGTSEPIQQLRMNINKLARSQAPVFIHGGSGVGKELVAQLIHKSGPRASKPFVPVNCGAIPIELMESEFFGHKKGSFTGAVSDKDGLFQAANGGTLFLDEIAELSLPMQVKLLRAIQEKAVKPVGSHQEFDVDVRILSASHKDLQCEITEQHFRQDLYYRINVIELDVPALKDHISDIPLLVESILKKLNQQKRTDEVSIDKACFTLLMQYDYPGNVRELENILERAAALCEGKEIKPGDLNLPQPIKLADAEQVTPSDSDLDTFLFETERKMILEALEKTKWNRTAAAKLLGISFRALRYRLRKLGIE